MRAVYTSIAAGLAGMVLCGLKPARGAAAQTRSPEPIVALSQARMPASAADRSAPPTMMAQGLVSVPNVPAPVLAVQPIPVAAVGAPGSVLRAVTPTDGSTPGVLWILAMGAVLCRFGARFLRVS